jgi:hypothetical protein
MAQLVVAVRHKPEARGSVLDGVFDFFFYLILAGVGSASNRNEYQDLL